MKTATLLATFPFLGMLYCSLATNQQAIAQTDQKAAILAVMQAKTEAYFSADTQQWQTFWIQDSSSSRAVMSRFGFESQVGWANVITALKKDSQEAGRMTTTLSHENVHLRTMGNLAFVEADEQTVWPGVASKTTSRIHTYTVLVKANQRWKIASQIRVDTDSYAPTSANREYELNAIGYDLLREKRVGEAIDLFLVNVKLNPDSWNAYDSLGEAYALLGNVSEAITQYEKSVALNPQNDNGKAVLERLKNRKP